MMRPPFRPPLIHRGDPASRPGDSSCCGGRCRGGDEPGAAAQPGASPGQAAGCEVPNGQGAEKIGPNAAAPAPAHIK